MNEVTETTYNLSRRDTRLKVMINDGLYIYTTFIRFDFLNYFY